MLKNKICLNCGSSKSVSEFHKNKTTKDGLAHWCKICTSEYKKQHYQKKREELLEYQKQYYKENTEERKEYARQYRNDNPEKVAKIKALWYKNNPEKVSEQRRLYNENNKDKIAKWKKQYAIENREHIAKYQKAYSIKNKERLAKYIKKYSKKYYKENPHVQRISYQRRRAAQQKLPYTLTQKQWEQIKEDFGYKCAYCGISEQEYFKISDEQLHQEHFVPLSRGGEYTHNNIVPSCRSCNSSKNNTDFKEWYPNYENYSQEREKFILDYLGYKTENIQQLSIL